MNNLLFSILIGVGSYLLLSRKENFTQYGGYNVINTPYTTYSTKTLGYLENNRQNWNYNKYPPCFELCGANPNASITNGGYIEIRGSGAETDPGIIIIGNNGNEKMRIANDGNVGIGTSSPNEKLHVTGNIQCSDLLRIRKGENNEGGQLDLEYPNGDIQFIDTITDSSSNKLRFFESTRNSGSDLVIDASSGNVGIGTSSPNEKLDVLGNITLDGNICGPTTSTAYTIGANPNASITTGGYIQLYGSTQESIPGNVIIGNIEERMRITNDGNVGIGTSSPNEKLDVSGNIKVTGNIINSTSFNLITNASTSPVTALSIASTGVLKTNGYTPGANKDIATKEYVDSKIPPYHYNHNNNTGHFIIGSLLTCFGRAIVSTPSDNITITLPYFDGYGNTNYIINCQVSNGQGNVGVSAQAHSSTQIKFILSTSAEHIIHWTSIGNLSL